MGSRKFVLIVVLLLGIGSAQAQVKTYLQVDSIANSLYAAGQWPELIRIGNQAIKDSIDFIGLRSKLGYAYLLSGNYSAALTEYNHVFKNDPADKVSRYYAYLCQSYLNNDPAASYNAAFCDSALLQSQHIKAFHATSFGLESGLKFNQDPYRGMASYNRLSLGLRLSWRLLFDQSLVYFGQPVSTTDYNNDGRKDALMSSEDNEFEYYGKLSYSISQGLTLLGVYHYLGTKYFSSNYYSNVGLFGAKYSGNYFNVQGDVNFGRLTGHALTQYDADLMLYPGGNLNFYAFSRFSYGNQNGNHLPVFNQGIGLKVFKNTWLETLATFGKLDNYIDTDGLYIYNSIDVSTFKIGETFFYELGKSAQLTLNYTLEKKQDSQNGVNYNQASITAGILWKF
jgi:hypothetical protein